MIARGRERVGSEITLLHVLTGKMLDALLFRLSDHSNLMGLSCNVLTFDYKQKRPPTPPTCKILTKTCSRL